MKPAALIEVVHALGARLVGGDEKAVVRGTAVDSRLVRPDQLFFALRGAKDGAEFAPEAHRRGAVATVAERPLEVPTIVVDDSLEALQKLARWSLSGPAAPAPTVVGITGTVGKTTTKDALAAILRSSGHKVCATEGNFNNEIGLPLTVLAAGERTEALVLEMGATHVGDVAALCEVAPPQVGVLTAVTPVHLDSFGSLEALASAKGELAQAVPESGGFVAPAGVPAAATGGSKRFARRVTFDLGASDPVDLWVSQVEEGEEGLRFVVHTEDDSAEVVAPVFGTHLIVPMLAAFGGALCLGVGLDACARGISRIKRTGLRGEVYRLRDEIVIYDDSYNASPAAMVAVLRYGAEQARRRERRFVAVLGSMFELGSGARAYHQEIGKLADEVGVDLLVTVGDEARWYAETFSGDTLSYSDAGGAAAGLQNALNGGEYVVVKGSRGVNLDHLTLELKERLALV
ncbi:MAG: UDP-N-acetylmuramoyl-tripeptide--D-alanyl-D-alanine ligase [Rubrobacteraceae bacterium]